MISREIEVNLVRLNLLKLLSANPTHKMIKYTQIIRWLLFCRRIVGVSEGLTLEVKFGDDPKHAESKVVAKPVPFPGSKHIK